MATTRGNPAGRRPMVQTEFPVELRPFFDMTDQRMIGRFLSVATRCRDCTARRYRKVSDIREALKHARLTGRCDVCNKRHRNGPGTRNPAWRGGRHITGTGYVEVWTGERKPCGRPRYAFEHRLVVERALGRRLLRSETVHHINGIKTDNRLENLELWQGGHPTGMRAVAKAHCPGCRCFTKGGQ